MDSCSVCAGIRNLGRQTCFVRGEFLLWLEFSVRVLCHGEVFLRENLYSKWLRFVLLADEQGEVARQFGVPLRAGGKSVIKDAQGQVVRKTDGSVIQVERKFTAARWTFVVDKDGLIVSIEKSASPRHDSQQVLDTAVQLARR